MSQRKMSDMHRCNKMTMITYSIMNFILLAAYLLEVVKKSRTVGYFMVFCAFALIPHAISMLVYKRDAENRQIKYIVSIGFGVFYLFIIFTTVSPIAYVYALLMAVILLCYNDTKLSRNYMIAICFGNVVQVIVMGIQGQVAAGDLANLEIRIMSVILFGVFMCMASWVVEQNNRSKVILIAEEKERTELLMQQIMDLSERLTGDIQVVSEKMDVLGISADKTKNSMEEVARGTGQTVDTIQLQLEKTEEIQMTVNRVTDASDIITKHVKSTKKELDASKKNIDNLIHHAQLSNEVNENVSKELAELYQYTDQMQSIVQMIDEVATQTSLLSLNASIEAARAGEAGRGFAVVASEISSLANQTQQATVTITSLINNISSELKDVVTMIEKMINNAQEQNEVVNNTAENFASIEVKNQRVYEEAGALNQLIKELAEANALIVKGIETISAVTEEVTAHSNETLESTNENHMITNEVGSIVERLHTLAQDLKNTNN